MSIFNELLPKILEISKSSAKTIDVELKAAFKTLEKFEEDYHNGRNNKREKAKNDKTLMTTLQSIHEDDDESKAPEAISNTDSKKSSKKRSKDEVEGIVSPELEKRQKRNASVRAQGIISKQVNVNLTQKMRREDSSDRPRGRRNKDDKESLLLSTVQVKQEKVSLPPEPMDLDSLSLPLPASTAVKKERDAMPPPAAPLPKGRRVPKENVQDKSDVSSSEEESSSRRTTRTKRPDNDNMMPPPAPTSRSTRASSRASRNNSTRSEEQQDMAPPQARPKRTRGRKKVSAPPPDESDKENAQVNEEKIGSPAEKPRPKRTRRGQKAAEKEQNEAAPEAIKYDNLAPDTISPKDEPKSPLLQKKTQKESKIPKKDARNNKRADDKDTQVKVEETASISVKQNGDKARVVVQETANCTVVLSDMDKTMVLANGVYNHDPSTPMNVRDAKTMVIPSASRDTLVLEKHTINDATMVLEKDQRQTNVTDDNSLLTDDNSEGEVVHQTPPLKMQPVQPTSAVKERVQQFEEIAARTTRTKTRAMAKMEEPETTPPERTKPVLSVETLTKMNSLIFNGKTAQISSSASKPRVVQPPLPSKAFASTSKLSSLAKHKEAADREKEDARKKKEAMLEAKRDMYKKKREEKMAAAALARSAAERDRRLAMEAAARERQEKQHHADQGKIERLKEVERKKQELARKVAETEERRRAEEQARQLRLAEEHRRAELARRRQMEEAEVMKKEAALMAKEIEKRQKEYIEKQKLKQMTPLKAAGFMEPVYMADGFQFLNSDEDEEPVPRPVPHWSSSKSRKVSLITQSAVEQQHVDALFSVRVHSPDLREIFPNIERNRLKRTSSAVWRTPPRLPPLKE